MLRRALRTVRGLGTGILLGCAVLACGGGNPPTHNDVPQRTPPQGTQAVNLLWFGHSLVQRAGNPPIDLPKLVDQLHHAARADGRTQIPDSRARAHVLQMRHLGHHLEGEAHAQLKAAKAAGITHVVGIGYMHMLGQRYFDYPSITYWLTRLNLEGYDSPRFHTEHIYRFMELMQQELPGATWVNYVGPALTFNKGPQASIDARHACIQLYGQERGIPVINAHAGQAFRRAEKAAEKRPDLKLDLRDPDGLHLTAQGAVLTASVIYRAVYGVDPVGLAIPRDYAEAMGDTPEQREAITRFLQEVARDTVASYAPACDKSLPEDEAFARGNTRQAQLVPGR